MEPHDIRDLTYEELKKYTEDFSDQNLIGSFQFGRVFHGIIESDWAVGRPVTVKIWDVPFYYYYYYVEGDNEIMMMDEYVLLRHEMLACHPGMMPLYGYCIEGEKVGVVYDFESKDTVQNLIIKGGFTWLYRVKVALGFADLLVFLHAENYQNGPFVIRNVDPSNIMVDKDYNPKLYDFGLIAGGIFSHGRRQNEFIKGCLGSIDHESAIRGRYTPETDVYAFGVLLLKLMSNDIDILKDVEDGKVSCYAVDRIMEKYEESGGSDSSMMNMSMVDARLQDDKTFFPEDGVEMSKLAYECADYYPEDRPTMKQVRESLLKLQIVEKYYDQLGMEQMIMKIKEELPRAKRKYGSFVAPIE